MPNIGQHQYCAIFFAIYFSRFALLATVGYLVHLSFLNCDFWLSSSSFFGLMFGSWLCLLYFSRVFIFRCYVGFAISEKPTTSCLKGKFLLMEHLRNNRSMGMRLPLLCY